MDADVIYVRLLDEDVYVCRPVKAKKLADDKYLILDDQYDRDIEKWEFEPGSVVRCAIVDSPELGKINVAVAVDE